MISKKPLLKANAKTADASRPWSWHRDALLKLRNRLLQVHDDQASEASEMFESESDSTGDTAADESDHDVSFALLANEEHRLQEVDAALRQIEDGTYGICEETGKKIPMARLKAIPWTRYTKAAAELLERQAMHSRTDAAP